LQVGIEDLSLGSLRLLLQLVEAKEILERLTLLRPPRTEALTMTSTPTHEAAPTSVEVIKDNNPPEGIAQQPGVILPDLLQETDQK